MIAKHRTTSLENSPDTVSSNLVVGAIYRYLRGAWWSALLFGVAMVMAGCFSPADQRAADLAVVQLHHQLDAAQYAEILSQADPAFKSSSSEEKLTQFLQDVHTRLGRVKSTASRGLFVKMTTSGTIVTQTYATKFELGDAEERFTWSVAGGKASLLGYRLSRDSF
jgi:hypothetical protein